MNINIENIDAKKADLGLRHEYIPNTQFNMEQPEDERIVVECEYLQVGEKVKYSTMSSDGEASIDIRRLFANKVKEIRNLKINGNAVVSASALLKYPGVLELEALVIDVATHLIKADELTGDERKNLSSASNSSEEKTSIKS